MNALVGRVMLDVSPSFTPGDLPPEGYLAWHEWAEVQHKAGIKQVQCGRCGLWRTPQELSATVDVSYPVDRYGRPVECKSPVCARCESKANNRSQP